MDATITGDSHRSIAGAETAITIRDFDLWYGDFQALKKINLEIPRNRATAFIAPSGCGKSTLLRTFNRMCDFVESVRTEGTIEFDGKDIFQMDANALRVYVGMVFQHPNPFPMSIRENILYGPKRMRRISKSEGDEICERCLTRAALWDEVKDDLDKSGLGPDDPFPGAAAHTVSATAARAGAAAMQLEINSALLMEDSPAERFGDVLAALAEAVEGLGAMLCARGE